MQKRKRHKLVVHLKDGSLVKGYFESPVEDISGLIGQEFGGSKVVLQEASTEQGDGAPIHIALEDTKALFFVNSFEGNSDYREVKFFETIPKAEGVWVRIMFQDREVIEGIVHNSLPMVTDRGFFLKPPDPQSNN